MPRKKSEEKTSLIRCGTCGGTGKVEKFFGVTIGWVVGQLDTKRPMVYVICPTCDGTGWVKK